MNRRKRAGRAAGILALIVAAAASARADEFDRLGGHTLATLLRDPQTRNHAALSFRELEALPSVLRDTRSALLIARTDQGNLARMLVAPGFRKPPGGKGPLVPVLVLERFETFDAGSPGTRLARGKDLMLFGGFRFDLDTGQIVPEGLGGDLVFNALGEEDGTLGVIAPAKLSTLEKAPSVPSADPGLPSVGHTVVPADFSGRYHLAVNGQWSGLLDLAVDPAGVVSGKFQSESSGSVYPVGGKVDAEAPQKLKFSVQFPRTRQDYTGLLWSEGKNVLAGTVTMLDREFGFVALREGARLSLDPGAAASASSVDVLPPGKPPAAVIRIRVEPEPEPDRFTVDGTPKAVAELVQAVSQALKANPKSRVVVTAVDSTPFSRIRQAIDAARSAGAVAIGLAADDERSLP
jgi:biopolymer transport protein ExbD